MNFNSIEEGSLSADAWSRLGEVLHELYMGNCTLRSLPAGVFDHMRQLRYLHLWNNQITVIPPKFFQVFSYINYAWSHGQHWKMMPKALH